MAENKTNINWYPGHMNKAKNQISETVKLVDLIVELRDSRFVFSSFNPLLDEICANKPRLLVLTKKDKADPKINQEFEEYFKENGINALFIDAIKDPLSKIIPEKINTILKDKIDKYKAKGIKNKVMRVMVIGIPNVGKSTFINRIALKNHAKVENRPGVTRSLNWIKISDNIDMLDTPGVLWPNLGDDRIAHNLALFGSINDDILDKEDLCVFALKYLRDNYPELLKQRYGLESIDEDVYKLIDDIGLSKKIISSDGIVDYPRLYNVVISDIRSSKLGRVSFERVCDRK